ncbi:hypothetical protein JCM10213_002515 [Rhodosporidiobolus nylandii]
MLHALPPTSGAPSLSSSLYPTAFPNAPSHSAAAQASLFSPPPYAALGRLFPPTFTPAMTQPFPPRPFARPSLDALPTPPSSPSFPPLELQRRQKPADEALPPLIAAAVGGVAQGEDDNMVQDDVFAWPSAEDLGIELDPEEEMVLPERERKGKSTE